MQNKRKATIEIVLVIIKELIQISSSTEPVLKHCPTDSCLQGGKYNFILKKLDGSIDGHMIVTLLNIDMSVYNIYKI